MSPFLLAPFFLIGSSADAKPSANQRPPPPRHHQQAYHSSSSAFPAMSPYSDSMTSSQPIPYNGDSRHQQQLQSLFAYSRQNSNPDTASSYPSSYSFSPPRTGSTSSSSPDTSESPSISELAHLAGLDLDAPLQPPSLSSSISSFYSQPASYFSFGTSFNAPPASLSPKSNHRQQARLDSFCDSLDAVVEPSDPCYSPPQHPHYPPHQLHQQPQQQLAPVGPTYRSLPPPITFNPSFPSSSSNQPPNWTSTVYLPPPPSTSHRASVQHPEASSSRLNPPTKEGAAAAGKSKEAEGEKKRRSSTSILISQSKVSASLLSNGPSPANQKKHVCPVENCSYSFVRALRFLHSSFDRDPTADFFFHSFQSILGEQNRQTDLTKHTRSHLPLDPKRPFPCSNIALCGRTFANEDSLEKHVGEKGCGEST